MSTMTQEELWAEVWAQAPLNNGRHTDHGILHWRQVYLNAVAIAEKTEGADMEVVKLFALFHDSRRENEWDDPDHGKRGSMLAQVMRVQGKFHLRFSQFILLAYACDHHDAGMTSTDPTVGTCWDADRLDLPRVGITPVLHLMSTEAGRIMMP